MPAHFHRLRQWARACALGMPALCAAGSAAASAADYPSAPITLVASSTAGGGVDVTARLIARQLAAILGQQVVVENRPGASGTIAGSIVARAPANGYTLFFTASNLVQSAAQPRKPPYALTDFAPVSKVGVTNLVLVANPGRVQARTLAELVAEIKARPGKYAFGSYGSGTSAHIYGELLNRSAGIAMVHVPYKGVAPAVNDVVSGQIPLAFADIGTIAPFLAAGRLRALAITGARRFPGLPEVPTFKESRMDGFELSGWYGVLAPAGTSAAIVSRLSQALDKAVATPDVQRALMERGVVPVGGSSEQFQRDIVAEEAQWTRLIEDNGIRGF